MSKAVRTRVVTGMLAAVVIAVVAGVSGTFYLSRKAADTPEAILAVIPDNTEVSLENIAHTASSDGRTQWRLTAEKARLTQGKRRLLLTRPAVVFYLEDGREVTLTADRGVLETGSNDIAVDGNVVISNRDYRLATEALRYTHGSRVLSTDRPVAIDGPWAALRALTMRVDLEADTAVFGGGVKGWLERDLS